MACSGRRAFLGLGKLLASTWGDVIYADHPGNTSGLYGGTLNNSVCDRQAMIKFLQAHPDKGAAWARVQGITHAELPSYISGLTPVVLRSDTSVTNHGFSDGDATTLHSVLQAGTAVLVDKYGVPRARCYCGNHSLRRNHQPRSATSVLSGRADAHRNVTLIAMRTSVPC